MIIMLWIWCLSFEKLLSDDAWLMFALTKSSRARVDQGGASSHKKMRTSGRRGSENADERGKKFADVLYGRPLWISKILVWKNWSPKIQIEFQKQKGNKKLNVKA